MLPQRGTFVKRISPRKVREGRFIREAIEAAVVRKAAVAITDAQLAELASTIMREQKAASKANDTAAFLACDEQFHFLIAQVDRLHCGLGDDSGHQGADGSRALSEPA